MRVDLSPAVLLHLRPWRETSAIIEIFSPEYGRLGLVAKGIRSGRSNRRGVLQPFQSLLLAWAGRGELPTLRQAEASGPARRLQGRPLLCGLYANELLMRLLPRGDAQPELFVSYLDLLDRLAAGRGLALALRLFEKQLLETVGFGLQLGYEAGSGAVLQADQRYDYDPDEGPVLRRSRQTGGFSGAMLMGLATGELDASHLTEARVLLRRVIDHHLEGRPLNSYKLLGG